MVAAASMYFHPRRRTVTIRSITKTPVTASQKGWMCSPAPVTSAKAIVLK